MEITLAHRALCSEEVLFQVAGEEAVLLDLASERYFQLDPIGTRVWTLLGEDDRLQRVYDILCVEYDGESESIARDLLALMVQLTEAGLVKIA